MSPCKKHPHISGLTKSIPKKRVWENGWNHGNFMNSSLQIGQTQPGPFLFEKRAAVSLCRLFLCSRWNLPLRCWQSQMKLKVSWIESFDMLSSLYSMSLTCGVSLPFGHVRFMLPNLAKLRFHYTRRPVSKHKTLFRRSILPKKMTLPSRIKYNMPCISLISSAGLFPLWFLPV